MHSFSIPHAAIVNCNDKSIHIFPNRSGTNLHAKTVDSFSLEWMKFSHFNETEIEKAGSQYFDLIDSQIINENSLVLDVGCGTGRWSKYLSPKVKWIEAIDPSRAVFSAAMLTKNISNIRISQASIDNIPFEDNSFDFVFSLGVLHHVPDTFGALQQCVKKVKPKGWLLLYLYYNLDNRGWLYRSLFQFSTLFRKLISVMPSKIKLLVCDLIAIVVYLPFVFFSRGLRAILPSSTLYKHVPLSYYWDKSFKIIRNDALDRFGTPLEQRFSKREIERMMLNVGLSNVKISPNEPYWHAVGQKI